MIFLLVRLSDIEVNMVDKNVFTTKMSSKGQIVIPEEVRNSLGLIPGTQFVVVGRGDTVILKSIEAPSMDELTELLTEARRSAKKAGLKKADLKQAIKESRSKK
jgi:AbrB family looped-hinge helix DNA binding protein